jgi:hypothetical protein
MLQSCSAILWMETASTPGRGRLAMFNTASPGEQLASTARSAVSPPAATPYPFDVGTANTTLPTSPSTFVPSLGSPD